MTIDFSPANHRASSSDLTVSISPLGLVELADEEFEVHGPRLNRYSLNWAMYLGHHYSYRRPTGESQLAFNYVRAFTDYLINFTFGQGVIFSSPKETEAIIPDLLKRVWEVDNNKANVMWEIGQQGSVSGDCFIKVAYEEPYEDTIGRIHPGRVRVLPLNSSFCFPEFHPHDRDRLIRFKLKYRFWGTALEGTRQVFTYTEILTEDRIEEYINDELIDSRENPMGAIPIIHIPNTRISGSPWGLSDCNDVLSLNRNYNEVSTDVADIINYHCVDHETEILTKDGWKRRSTLHAADEVFTLDPDTGNTEWQVPTEIVDFAYNGPLVRWSDRIDALTTPNHRWLVESRHGRGRRFERQIARTSEGVDGDLAVTDLTQGSRIIVAGGNPTGFAAAPTLPDEVVETLGWWVTEGAYVNLPSGSAAGNLSQSVTVNPEKVSRIRALREYWASGGHSFSENGERPSGAVTWYLGTSIVEELERLCPGKSLPASLLTLLTAEQAQLLLDTLIDADGTRHGVDGKLATFYQDDQGRVDGFQMLVAMLGKRSNHFLNNRGDGVTSIYHKDHILAEETSRTAVEEYPEVPAVWCVSVPNGVWLARRNGVTYWTGNSAPVTIVSGAKASTLEKGANKVWGGIPKDAKVYNLEGGGSGLAGAMQYLDRIKQSMHEMVGIPESALGQMQPISNTSGVALSIMYQPLMNKWRQKTALYAKGLERVNELIILLMAIKEPHMLMWQENDPVALREGQYPALDPQDPLTYRSEAHFPPPLPFDKLVVLNEIQAKMSMGLESKEGALRALGEEYPDEKMSEIRKALVEEAKADGALDLIKAQIQLATMFMTGSDPLGPDGEPGTGDEDAGEGGGMAMPPEGLAAIQQMMAELVTRAYGTTAAQSSFAAPQNQE